MVDMAIVPTVLSLVLGGIVLWMLRFYFAPGSVKTLPGSLGWPIIGETVAFGSNMNKWLHDKAERHGTLFRSHLFGKYAVVGTTLEFAKFVFSNTHLFKHYLPASMVKIVGPRALPFYHEPQHMTLKKVLMKPILPANLATKVTHLSDMVLQNLNAWADQGESITIREGRKISWNTAYFFVLGEKISDTPESKEMWRLFVAMSEALIVPPVDLPGTTFREGLHARREMVKIVTDLLNKRRQTGNISEYDILGCLMLAQEDPELKKELDLEDEAICDTLVSFLIASYHTLASTITWALKLLTDYPDVRRSIQAEQEDLFKRKKGSPITWEDTRSMEYSIMFLQELHRLVSLVGAGYAEAVTDVEYKGHVIPKDTLVVIGLVSIHEDPSVYDNPREFNPSRFKESPAPFSYLPFLTGARKCAGFDVARLLTLLFIHHLVTKFEWSRIGPDLGIEIDVSPTPKDGYPCRIWRKD